MEGFSLKSLFLLQVFQHPVVLTFHSYLLPTVTCLEPIVLLTAAMPMHHLLSITCMRPQVLTKENSFIFFAEPRKILLGRSLAQ